MPNTWLFITCKPQKIAITCNGIREDVPINGSGIIQISQECTISTKQNILATKRTNTVPVLASYFKPVSVPMNFTMSIQNEMIIPQEPVISINDGLNEFSNDQQSFARELQETEWKKIHHHSLIASGGTSITIILAVMILWFGISRIHQCVKNEKKMVSTAREQEMIELQSLRSSHSETRQNV